MQPMKKKAAPRKRTNPAKALRLRVFATMGNSEVAPHILIGNMAMVCKWLETGIEVDKDGKSLLKLVSGGV